MFLLSVFVYSWLKFWWPACKFFSDSELVLPQLSSWLATLLMSTTIQANFSTLNTTDHLQYKQLTRFQNNYKNKHFPMNQVLLIIPCHKKIFRKGETFNFCKFLAYEKENLCKHSDMRKFNFCRQTKRQNKHCVNVIDVNAFVHWKQLKAFQSLSDLYLPCSHL